MDFKPPIEAATQYLEGLSLECQSAFIKFVDNIPTVTEARNWPLRVKLRRLFKSLLFQNKLIPGYTVEVVTIEGVASVHMSRNLVINWVSFTPSSPGGLLLPLWAAFPHFTSVTIFWRMCPGEDYMLQWREWYRGLTDAERFKYQERFPTPADPQRAWEGWYEMLGKAEQAIAHAS
ncbi:MAG TPA: hypothetical protein VH370_25135 [Humisphaera sp.]|jgi:hypothetical protein|nr:hypothetical protein [Humisphaera sp.]